MVLVKVIGVAVAVALRVAGVCVRAVLLGELCFSVSRRGQIIE